MVCLWGYLFYEHKSSVFYRIWGCEESDTDYTTSKIIGSDGSIRDYNL